MNWFDAVGLIFIAAGVFGILLSFYDAIMHTPWVTAGWTRVTGQRPRKHGIYVVIAEVTWDDHDKTKKTHIIGRAIYREGNLGWKMIDRGTIPVHACVCVEYFIDFPEPIRKLINKGSYAKDESE